MSDSDRRKHFTFGRIATGLAVVVILAVVVLVSLRAHNGLVVYQGHHAEQRQAAAEHQAANSHDEAQRVCVTVPRRAEACVEQPPQPDPGAQYTHADLQAQQEMAEWAYGVFQTGIGTLFLSFVGVILLYFTLRSTNETLAQAREQVRLAKEAAASQEKLSADSATAVAASANAASALATSDRAWLFIDLVAIPPIQAMGGAVIFFTELQFRVANHGGTPAIIKKINVAAYWLPGGEKADMAREANYDPDGATLEERNVGFLRFTGASGIQWPSDDYWPPQQLAACDVMAPEVILPASSAEVVSGRMTWNREDMQEAQVGGKDRWALNGSSFWFHIIVDYEDVWGRSRMTSYYRGARNGGLMSLKSGPASVHAKYNKRT